MSCPDWRTLTTARRDADPEAWQSALAHFDDCSLCRRDALTAEPTLLFRRLPTLEAGADQIADMQRAVATMRRARSMEEPRGRAPYRQPPLGEPSTWLRAAALAAVLLGAALLRGTGPATTDRVEHAALGPGAVSTESLSAVNTAPASFDPARLPLVEDVDPSYGSVIQVMDDDFAIVMVVAQPRENLDV
ncbi:MAG: hypothetical protein GY856_27655 [bacterium]|nr:hypothetical protein [bacterium]